MPLVRYSALYDLVSGRVKSANVVNSQNNGQAIVRGFVSPAQPNTDNQQLIKAKFSNLTKNWKNLSTSDRNAWIAWANDHPVVNRLGNTVRRTGVSAYVQLGTLQYIRTGSYPTSAPTLERPAPVTEITGVYSEEGNSGFIIQFTHGYTNVTNLYVIARMTAAVPSPAIVPKPTDYRLVYGPVAGVFKALTVSPAEIGYPLETVFPHVIGERIGVSLSIVNAEGWESEQTRGVFEIELYE